MSKRKKIFSSIIFVIMFLFVFMKNTSYGTIVTSDSQKHYVGITEMRTNDEPNMGYAIGDPRNNGTGGQGVTLWNLVEYASESTDSGLKVNGNKNIYCLKAGVGFSSNDRRTTYDVFFDMKKEKESIAAYNDLLNSLVNEKSFEVRVDGENVTVSRYDALVALADMLFLIDDSDEETYTEDIKNYLSKAGINEYAYDVLLTRDDIAAVQQAAIWYFTNYEEENGKYDKTSPSTGWLTYILKATDDYKSLSDYNPTGVLPQDSEGAQRQEQAEILYNYLIKAAKENAAKGLNSDGDSDSPVTIDTSNLQCEQSGTDYILGPVKITEVAGNTKDYTIDLVVDNMGVEITDYTLLNSDKEELPAGTKVSDLVGSEFYVKVASLKLSEEQQKRADVNGDNNITQEDANLILQYDAGNEVTIPSGKGDVNQDGEINYADAVAILRYLDIKDNNVLTNDQVKKADINGDGYVTKEDADIVLKYDAGEEVTIQSGKGDINDDGEIDYNDAILILQYNTSYYLTKEQQTLADVNGDGIINSKDIEMIMQKETGMNPDGFIEGRGDVNGDGQVNYADAVKISQYIEYCGIKLDITVKYQTNSLELWTTTSTATEEQPILMPSITEEEMNESVGVVPVEKDLDLSLRKYITQIGENALEGTNSRVPSIDTSSLENGTTATYKHKKDPVEVITGDEIIYNITIYNEGEKEGRATKIIDQLPEGLRFVEVVSGNFESTSYSMADNLLTLTRVNGNNENLAGYTGEGDLASETIQIKCQVEAEAESTNKVLTNLAWIAEEIDGVTGETITTEEGKDRDSEPSTITSKNKDELVTEDTGYTGNETNQDKDLTNSEEYFEGQQDDDDFEKIIINAVTSITVKKEWNDSNNQDGLRPNTIVVELLRNDQPTGITMNLSSGNGWTATFNNLPVEENGVNFKYTVRENTVISGYETPTIEQDGNNFTITNTHTPEKTSVKVVKTWNDANNQDGVRPANITVQLYKNGTSMGEDYKITLPIEGNWEYEWTELDKKTGGVDINYTVRELNSEGVAVEDGKAYDDNYTATYEVSGNTTTITNTHTPEVTSVSVNKVWNDNNNQDGLRLPEIEVELLKNGEPTGTTKKLNEGNSWRATFNNLPLKENGVKIEYTVKENTEVPEYETNIEETTDNNFTITNTHTPAVTNIKVIKTWNDANNQDGVRPTSIEVQLYKNGASMGESYKVTLPLEESWEYEWTGLAQKEDGIDITYTVKELNSDGVAVEDSEAYDDNYTATYAVQGNTTTITNTHTPAVTSISVNKVWNDSNNQDGLRLPEIEVELLKNGEPTGTTKKLNEGNSWTGTFDNLPLKENGVEIEYTVKENTEIPGYTKDIVETTDNNFTITNSYTPGETSVKVIKTWNDSENQDGVRPENVVVQLYKNGTTMGDSYKVTLPIDGNWEYEWTGLAQKESGVDITYTVKELNASGTPVENNTAYDDNYTATYEIQENTTTITNTHTPAVISVNVNKVWDDNNNQDGLRLPEIEVELLKNGEPTGTTKKLNEGNSWTATFNNLPLKENGVEIEYTVRENTEMPEYETSIEETTDNNFTITNTHTPSVTSVSVNKGWNDNNNQDGLRLPEIEVELLKNGEATGRKAKLNEENNWTATFDNLPLKENGVEIEYTVKENTEIPGYTTNIEETLDNNFTITNIHTPGETSVKVIKTWNDVNNQDGVRPENVTVQLYKNGTSMGDSYKVTLPIDGNWEYEWTGLAQKESGVDITYTVKELNSQGVAVEDGTEYDDNYTATYAVQGNTTTITNTHTPAETSISVNKVWEDNNNQDGLRLPEIEVELLKNGEPTGTTEKLNERNSWTATFNNLPLKENGVEIEYTVKENTEIPGYEISIEETSDKNFTITNTHTPEVTSVSVNKVWEDNNNQDGLRLLEIEVELLKNGEPTGTTKKLNEGNTWTATFDNLPLKENGENIEYTIKENTEIPGYTTNIEETTDNNFTITNSYTPGETSVKVIKAWSDANNQDGVRPENVVVQLYKNGTTMGDSYKVTLPIDGNWEYEWTRLPQKEDGEDIEYTVKELNNEGIAVEDGAAYDDNYTVTYAIEGNTTKITNTHTPAVTSVSVNKIWEDNNNQDGLRLPEIEVELLKNGEATGTTAKLNEGNSWTATFDNLPLKENGVEIEYTVRENTEIPEYTKDIEETTDNNFTITNSYTPGETSVKVVKTWDDANNQDGVRPENIVVQLYKNGESMGDDYKVTLPIEGNWEYEWTGLNKKEAGAEINYTVKELNVSEVAVENGTAYDDNYTATYAVQGNTTTITNIHTPELTSITVNKVWDDNNNQDGLRLGEVEVELLKNGEPTGTTKKLNEGNSWTATFDNLPLKENGVEIEYTVRENTQIPGYTINIAETTENNFTITNKHIPGETSVKVIKTWNDANNQDGVRPENITIQLYKNETTMGDSYKVTLPIEGKWEYEWTGLEQKEDGENITYTVKELNSEGVAVEDGTAYDDNYTATYAIEGNTTTITNKHTPGETSVKVIKTWNDLENQDGVRPENIVVQLYKNETSMGESYKVTLPIDGSWEYEWTGLELKENGENVEYTVKELNSEGVAVGNGEAYDDNYTATYAVQGNTTTITNTHTPGITSISVNKVWEDNNNQDGLRQEVEVELYANDEATGQKVTLNDGNNWTETFDNLPLKENGVEIKYTVKENTAIEGYEEPVISQDGNNFTITNIKIKDFDLSLRKYITAVGNNTLEETSSRVPNIDTSSLENGTTATYKHKKDPVEVATGDEVIYNITIYNEGEKEGRATKVVDQLPSGLEFVEVVSGNFEVTQGNYNTDTNTITLTRVANNNENLAGYTGEGELASETIQIKCRVTAGAGATDKVLTNLAWISEEVDGVTGETITTEEGKDRDSEPSTIETQNKDQLVTEDEGYTGNESNQGKDLTDNEEYFEGQQDDDDFEKVVIKAVTSVSVNKVWDDNNNQDGLRLGEVEVELLKNGEPTGTTAKLNEGNSWTATFDNLPLKENREDIEYTVRENTEIPGYTIDIAETTDNNFTITNKHTPGETSVKVIKTWNDSENQDGVRPENVTVQLYKNETSMGESYKVTLPIDGSWEYEWTGLELKENGENVEYTVKELNNEGVAVEDGTAYDDNYTATYAVQGNTTTITNTHTPGMTSVSVNKVWEDNNNQDGLRLGEVEVELLKNGEVTGTTAKLNEGNNWTATFDNLPLKENGEDIEYTVRENTEVPEYETSVEETTDNNFTVTNTHIVKEFDLALRKFIVAVSKDETIEESELLQNEDGSYIREPVVDTSKLNTTDEEGNKITTATYNHTKEQVAVQTNDYVIYVLKVYNEGERDGYAGEIKDYLPEYLEYVDNEFNRQYGWEVSEDGRTVSSRYLENTLIGKAEQDENGNYVLSYAELPIMCKISETAKTNENMTNIAEITEYQNENKQPVEDRDSQEDNVNVPGDEELPGYKEDETGEYIPGQQDDDDFEKVIVQNFDLALRKFIVAVSEDEALEESELLKNEDGSYTREPVVDTSLLNTTDENGNMITTAIYNHTKEPVLVQTNNYVVYMLRVYNEGDLNGYVGEIKDHLPPYLEYVDNEFNRQYGWEVSEDGRTVTTNYLEDTLITKAEADENGSYDLSYAGVLIMCKVSENANTNENITNIAEITEYLDENKESVGDRDSEEDNVNVPNDEELPGYKDDETGEYIPGQQDDDDFEKVIVKIFDLSLRKWVTQAIVTDNTTGQTTVTQTGHQPYDDPEDIVKVELYRKNINNVTVKFRYSIRVTNEGEIAGYAKEVTDYVPEGLKFLAEDNPNWTDEGNNIISTKQLENTLLQPGEYAEVEVVLTWINNEDNMGVMNNIAEISEDHNEYGIPDKDSTPDNQKDGEDDIDDAPVMLSISTGQVRIYFTLGFIVLITVAGGVGLIKKYVL